MEAPARTGLDWIYSYFVTAVLRNLLTLPRECPFLTALKVYLVQRCVLIGFFLFTEKK